MAGLLRQPLLLLLFFSTAAATTYSIQSYYSGGNCDGTPYGVLGLENANCTTDTCSPYDGNSSTVHVDMVSVECSTDYIPAMRQKFGDSPYLLVVSFGDAYYWDDTCTALNCAYGLPASSNCVGSFNMTHNSYAVGRLETNGSASLQHFTENSCLANSWVTTERATKETLYSHSCDQYGFQWYSSRDDSDSGSGTGTVAITGIVCGTLALTLSILVSSVCYRHRVNAKSRENQLPSFVFDKPTLAGEKHPQGLWNDDVIIAKRVPRDKVVTQQLISRGAFGEVYSGVYNGKQVAVKMLLSDSNSNLQTVNNFLAAAKTTIAMDHPHIVAFVGVAWDSLSDMCVVLEFMDNGDLRSLLDKYLVLKNPIGLNRQKTTIALQICHALTYLHSLATPVIHRDLKSRNILLNRAMEAKLCDFGISRERLGETMTAGVGTTLWMAPEVMLGERYDEKADMFSFGVVLSELDVHTLPYTQTKQQRLNSEDQAMADATLLQLIITGAARVGFSPDLSPTSLLELGYACVSVDPRDRPSAAQALYQLHRCLKHELL